MSQNYYEFLNDTLLRRLADLFLYRLDIDKSSTSYKRLRGAVILISRGVPDVAGACEIIARSENTSTANVLTDLRRTVDDLDPAIDETFNKYYSPDDLFMPHSKKPDDVIAFLGTIFLYILESNFDM